MKVAVIGAGVVGRLTALSLLNQGTQVSLFEKSELTSNHNAAFVSAGMISPISESAHAHPEVVDLGFKSLSLWPKILQRMAEYDPLGRDVYFRDDGSLVVASAHEQPGLQQFHNDIKSKLAARDVDIKPLTNAQLNNIEPDIKNSHSAFLLQPEAQLCNRSFLTASTRVLLEECHSISQQQLTLSKIKKLQDSFDYVVDCRGEGAIDKETIQQDIGPLRGVRGEVIRVHCPDVSLNRFIRVIHPRHPIYIVPKQNSTFVVGATEVESKSTHPITVRSTLELLNTLYSINPAFAEATILESHVGVRAAYLDNAPSVLKKGNLISANGLYRHGWLTGPAISQKIVNHIQESN
ncbi:FAD-dependent oxidoreductase [Reinekea forsetii]|nr:FAD-dependent oxidoreductase [Reinekea forsetii]